MTRTAMHALTAWWLATVAGIAALFMVLGMPSTADGGGEAIGRLVALSGTAALLAWLVARGKSPAWGGGRFALFYIAMLLGLTMVTAIGRARATEPVPPFTVAFEDGWSTTTLNGVSSDPRDQADGLRQRAQWQGADGTAAMEFTCMWKTSEIDLEHELRQITDGVAAGMQANGLAFVEEAPHRVRTGSREWHVTDGRIEADGEIVGRQRFSVASGERCFLSATFAGTPLAYEQQLPAFKRVLASLREAPAQ